MVHGLSRRFAFYFFDGGKVANDLFQIYYDLFTCEDEAEFENVYINPAYAKVIQSVDEKLILKDFKLQGNEQVELNELEQIAVVQRQKAINRIKAEDYEKMKEEAERQKRG